MRKTTPWPDTTEDEPLPDWFAAEQDEADKRMWSDPATRTTYVLSVGNAMTTVAIAPLRADAAIGRKVRHADRLPKTEKPVGRPTGVSNRDWDEPPSAVGETYREYKSKPGMTKRDAMRETCADYGVNPPQTDKQCDRLVKTLDGWATKEWTLADELAYEFRHATRVAKRKPEAREPKSKKRKRPNGTLHANFYDPASVPPF